ncbi:MAG: hypothetical protein KAY37_04470 [Phycisphaerae bacterium]|nr:hypothetical protein [Phycisphaerae bacterium]
MEQEHPRAKRQIRAVECMATSLGLAQGEFDCDEYTLSLKRRRCAKELGRANRRLAWLDEQIRQIELPENDRSIWGRSRPQGRSHVVATVPRRL